MAPRESRYVRASHLSGAREIEIVENRVETPIRDATSTTVLPHRVNDVTRFFSARLKLVPGGFTFDVERVAEDDCIVVPVSPYRADDDIVKYRTCYGPVMSTPGYCCANKCSQPEMSAAPCRLCYSDSYAYPAGELVPCRCDCLVFQHDVCWTHVSLGSYRYARRIKRIDSFISGDECVIEVSSFLNLVNEGFVFVRYELVPVRRDATDSTVATFWENRARVRCYACLFTATVHPLSNDVSAISKEHALHSPYCAYTKVSAVPISNERVKARNDYYLRFAHLVAVCYAQHDTCYCRYAEPYTTEDEERGCEFTQY